MARRQSQNAWNSANVVMRLYGAQMVPVIGRRHLHLSLNYLLTYGHVTYRPNYPYGPRGARSSLPSGTPRHTPIFFRISPDVDSAALQQTLQATADVL